MNTSLLLMNKLFSMMLIAAVGFTTVRTGLLDTEDSKRVAKLSLYALGPCLIISALQVELTPERLHGYIAALVFSLLVQTGFIGLEASSAGWVLSMSLRKCPSFTPTAETSFSRSSV